MDYGVDYNYGYDAANAAVAAGLGAAVGSVIMICTFISIAFYIIQVIAFWKIFTKAGEEGWKSIIPIYNVIVLFKIAGISPWLILLYLLAFIPIVGWLVSVGLSIYFTISLSKAFGQSTAFTVGLILLPSIFYLILGFGSSEYQLDQTSTENI